MPGAATAASTGAGAAGTAAATRRTSPVERQQKILNLTLEEKVGLYGDELKLIEDANERLGKCMKDIEEHKRSQEEKRRGVKEAEFALKNIREAMERVTLDEGPLNNAQTRLHHWQREFVQVSQRLSRLESDLGLMAWDPAQDTAALILYADTFRRRYMAPSAARALAAAQRVLQQRRHTQTSMSPVDTGRVMQMASWSMDQLRIANDWLKGQAGPVRPDARTKDLLRDAAVFMDMLKNTNMLGEAELLQQAVDELQATLWRSGGPEAASVATAAEQDSRKLERQSPSQ
ncbi:uncharacterized protein EMH_0082810 [Eimeria mitis]|uniref:Uncharacterized protein n=1 Tax=Eimeria mitis TaxID=44415 RepID=U6K9I3_9EIME|nr:uncharacterized protein EMH_0082810 [Eimeria mitis]CDJ33466.1 hypothetical protein EMH_0082810 [Eimeria mitis]